jgi:hypothetical protein
MGAVLLEARMNHRTGSCFLAMMGALLVGVSVRAQTVKPSHLPIPAMPGASSASPDGIQGQLDQLAFEELLRRALKNPEKYGLDKKDVRPLQPQKPGAAPNLDPNDPKVRDLVEKLYNQYKDKQSNDNSKTSSDISPEMLEKLRKQYEQYLPPQGGSGNPGGSGPGSSGPNSGDPPKEPEGQKQVPSISGAKPPIAPSKSPPVPDTGNQPTPDLSEADKKESEAKKALAKAVETFKESGSLAKAIQSFSEGDENNSGKFDRWDDDGQNDFDWARFGKQTGIDRLEKWLPKMDWNWSDVASKMPSVSAPGLNSNVSSALPSGPTTLEAGGSILTVFLVLALLVVFAIVAWKFRAWFAGDAALAAEGAWHLGPWPVQPALVRTREELIRAFEYLSLLRLGRPARNWNHHQIAAELGQTKDVPANGPIAAVRLASVYEHARYAPAADLLADPELEAARRDLCLLAGVPGA